MPRKAGLPTPSRANLTEGAFNKLRVFVAKNNFFRQSEAVEYLLDFHEKHKGLDNELPKKKPIKNQPN